MKKISVLMAIGLPFFLLLSPAGVRAQALTPDSVKAQLVQEWVRAKAYTLDYLKAMPAEKYSFKATDSIRSFAQQMLHLAQANLFLMSKAIDQQPPVFLSADLEHSTAAQQKDSVTYYVSASYDYCIEGVKNTDVNKWGEKKELFGMHASRFALMIKTFEHQTHHRGQATIYIRLQGMKPPEERLF
ncbi:MAG: DinB family protein [Ferruginibacter sp.]